MVPCTTVKLHYRSYYKSYLKSCHKPSFDPNDSFKTTSRMPQLGCSYANIEIMDLMENAVNDG